MSLVLVNGPTVEPVSLAEAKAHCRIDTEADDAVVTSLIVTSRLHIEAALGLALIAQQWRLGRDAWPALGTVKLPLRPILSVSAITVANTEGTRSELDRSLWSADSVSPSGVTVLRPTAPGGWPAPGVRREGIEIHFEAGFGHDPSDVPAPIRHATLLLIAHWYENREPLRVLSDGPAVPAAVSALLAPYKRVSL